MEQRITHIAESEPTQPERKEEFKAPKKKNLFQKFIGGVGALLKWSLVTIIAVFVFVAVAMAIPTVQTFLGHKASDYLSYLLDFDINIEKLEINLLNNELDLKGLHIVDHNGKTMVSLELLAVQMNPIQGIGQKDIVLEQLDLKQGEINLIYDESGQLNINEFIAQINALTRPKKPRPKKEASAFTIERGYLEGILLTYHDPRVDSVDQGFDYGHFQLERLSGFISNFSIAAGDIQLQANSLKAIDERSGLKIKDLTTTFRLNDTSMQFNELYAEINRSVLRDSLVFNFDSIKAMSQFIQSVDIQANIKESAIHTRDLALFAPAVSQYSDIWQLSGRFSGTVEDFFVDNLKLGLGDNTYLEGSVDAEGLPAIEVTLASIRLDKAQIDTRDLKQYITDEEAYRYTRKFGLVQVSGRFDGFISDFVANGSFETQLGRIDSDIHLITSDAIPRYKGRLATNNFQLGELIDQPKVVGALTMEGNIEGKGFSLDQLSAYVDVQVPSVEILGYRYTNIKADGTFEERYFNGRFDINDPSAIVSVEGEIDLRETLNKEDWVRLNVQGNIEKLALEQLGLIGFPLHLATRLDLQTQGASIETVKGRAAIRDMQLEYKEESLVIDSLFFYANKAESGERQFELISDLATLKASGNFTFEEISRHFNELVEEYSIGLKNDAEEIEKYYKAKKRTEEDKAFTFNYEAQLKNVNPLLHIFEPTAHIAPNTDIRGYFNGGETTKFLFETNQPIDSLVYKDYHLYKVNIDLESSKSTYENDILAQLDINSQEQDFSFVETENYILNATWYDGSISFITTIKQQDTTNNAQLEGYVMFEEDRTQIEFGPSYIQIANAKWQVAPYRTITLYNDSARTIGFEQIALSNQGQQILIDGYLADSTAKRNLAIDIEGFEISFFNQFVDRELDGTLFTQLTLSDIYQQIKLEGSTDIEGVAIDGFFLGHVSGKSLWDAETNRIKLDFNVFSRVDYILFVEGSYGLKDQSLDFLVELRNTEMSIIEPFAKEYISELGGQVSGKVLIKGNTQAPKVSGVLDFNQSRFKVNYLGTKFTFSDKVYISEDEIKIKRLRLLDSKNHVAIVRGSIYHQSFKNLYFRLFSEFDNFILIDTEREDNDLYYGTAVVTGEASIIGDAEDIKISGNISNERGTKIFIPLDGYETTTQKNYIEFVDLHAIRQDTVAQTIQQLSLKGIRMDLNLDIDENAYFEIIFDQKAGDIIRGRGEGKIQMAIDTKGEFSMYGDYYIKQGSYNFTLMNLVNKKFEIRDNSRILFVGGLFDAELQVFASYDQPTSLAPLVDPALLESESGNPDFTRRYPVSVLLELNGALLAPDIKLSLDFKEAERTIQDANLRIALINYQATLANNEQELNRQAFSLILLKVLSPPNALSEVSAASSSGRNLSELLSNQLSHWMSQVDENLQIDVDLLNSDVNNNNAYQVTLTYTFMEGRLRVTRDGLVDTQNQNTAANIVGEWTVEYLLTKDGRYRLKMYNRNTPDISADNINGNTTTTAGFSITQTQNFNTLRELFGLKPKEKKNKKKRKKEKTPEEEEEEIIEKLEEKKKPVI